MTAPERHASDRLAELMKEVRAERRSASRDDRPPTALGGTDPHGRGKRVWPAVRRWARRLVLAALVLVLPFFVLLRSATWLYGSGRLGTWAALAVGAALTFLLLAGYVLGVRRWVRVRFARPAAATGPGVATKRLLQGTAILVLAYCAYGLVFLSAGNAKTEAVRTEYRSLHPMLRMAVGTLVLVDSDLLVTDAARDLDDYAAMGLPANEQSLHRVQADGYAHALDLRTAGRPGWVNFMVRAWFRATGFRTLRHVGTADHLHVSLPLPPG